MSHNFRHLCKTYGFKKPKTPDCPEPRSVELRFQENHWVQISFSVDQLKARDRVVRAGIKPGHLSAGSRFRAQ